MDMVTKKPDVAPTEVTPKAKRRTYSPAFKRKILAEADAAAAEPGQVAALLRRHGLYSSHLTEWRRAREAPRPPRGRARATRADARRDTQGRRPRARARAAAHPDDPAGRARRDARDPAKKTRAAEPT